MSILVESPLIDQDHDYVYKSGCQIIVFSIFYVNQIKDLKYINFTKLLTGAYIIHLLLASVLDLLFRIRGLFRLIDKQKKLRKYFSHYCLQSQKKYHSLFIRPGTLVQPMILYFCSLIKTQQKSERNIQHFKL